MREEKQHEGGGEALRLFRVVVSVKAVTRADKIVTSDGIVFKLA